MGLLALGCREQQGKRCVPAPVFERNRINPAHTSKTILFYHQEGLCPENISGVKIAKKNK
jgi:hypothetical protein